MVLLIASIQVLTGEVTQRFEAEAQSNYDGILTAQRKRKNYMRRLLKEVSFNPLVSKFVNINCYFKFK